VSPPAVSGPADAVRLHYAHINSRNFAAAWDLLSPRFQAGMSYENWVRGFHTTRAVQTPSVSVVAQSGSSATVAVTIVSLDAAGSSTISKTFQGTWNLVQSGGTWKLDTANIRQAN
jgi:hypothetical protein